MKASTKKTLRGFIEIVSLNYATYQEKKGYMKERSRHQIARILSERLIIDSSWPEDDPQRPHTPNKIQTRVPKSEIKDQKQIIKAQIPSPDSIQPDTSNIVRLIFSHYNIRW